MNTYKFECTLEKRMNDLSLEKSSIARFESEESFVIKLCATSLVEARKELDNYLQKEWGYVKKQMYKNETVYADRYWLVNLTNIYLGEKHLGGGI